MKKNNLVLILVFIISNTLHSQKVENEKSEKINDWCEYFYKDSLLSAIKLNLSDSMTLIVLYSYKKVSQIQYHYSENNICIARNFKENEITAIIYYNMNFFKGTFYDKEIYYDNLDVDGVKIRIGFDKIKNTLKSITWEKNNNVINNRYQGFIFNDLCQIIQIW